MLQCAVSVIDCPSGSGVACGVAWEEVTLAVGDAEHEVDKPIKVCFVYGYATSGFNVVVQEIAVEVVVDLILQCGKRYATSL